MGFRFKGQWVCCDLLGSPHLRPDAGGAAGDINQVLQEVKEKEITCGLLSELPRETQLPVPTAFGNKLS